MIPTPVQGPARDAVAIIAQRLVAWGLPPDDAAFALQGAVHWRDVAPREYLFTQDAPVTAIYLLVEGRVLQEKIIEDGQGNRRVILRREAQPGEWIGHYDMLYTEQYGTRARAIEPSRVIEVATPALNRLLYR